MAMPTAEELTAELAAATTVLLAVDAMATTLPTGGDTDRELRVV